MGITTPTTADNNRELSAARGGISQCRHALRAAQRLHSVDGSGPGVARLHDAIDALSVSVESLAKVVQGMVQE
jgi:hypothetical protein